MLEYFEAELDYKSIDRRGRSNAGDSNKKN